MKYDQEYIYDLLLRKQLGELSEEEDKLLQKIMLTDEQVRQCWHEHEEAKLYTQNAFLEDLRAEHDWCKVVALLTPRPLYVRMFDFVLEHKAVAAAVLVSAFAVAGTFLQRKNPPSPVRYVATRIIIPADRVTQPSTFIPAINPVYVSSTDSIAASPPVKDTVVAIKADQPLLASNEPVLPAETQLSTIPLKRITHDSIYQSNTIEWNTLTVPPRMDYRIELADGTEVHLNASSTLRFPFIFPGKTREVYLEGEAYFTVAHKPSQPFVVHTGTTSVIALGTAFNINSYDNNIITTSLVTGSVVTDVGDSLDVTLKPGYEATYRPGERFSVKRFDENVTLGWRDGMFRFQNKPLEDLAPVMKRWFGLKMSFSSNSIARQLFTYDLNKDIPVTDFLDGLCLEAGLDYKIYDGTIHFSAQKQ
jgi:hypothetical protein